MGKVKKFPFGKTGAYVASGEITGRYCKVIIQVFSTVYTHENLRHTTFRFYALFGEK